MIIYVSIKCTYSEMPRNEAVGLDLKVVIIGDVHVGKTSLIRKEVFNEFTLEYVATHGVNFNKIPKLIDWKRDWKEICLDVSFF